MRRLALKLAVGALLSISWAAQAAPVSYVANLNGGSENPPVASAGTGSATIFLDTAAHTLRVVVSFSGLVAGTTASHIHCCIAPPGNAGVATATPTFPGFPSGVTSGTYDQTFNTTLASSWNAAFITAQGGTPAAAEAALAQGLATGQAYLNIHSSTYPGGEIRGFLTQPPPPATGSASSVPTLSEWTMALLIATLAGVGLYAARRRS